MSEATEQNQVEQSLEERVKAALDEIRPYLQRDGGDIEFVELSADNVVTVKLRGACAGCPMSMQTLKNGVENFVRERAPEIKSVEAITNIHRAQLLTYLRLSRLKVGLLINFNVRVLKEGIERFVL